MPPGLIHMGDCGFYLVVVESHLLEEVMLRPMRVLPHKQIRRPAPLFLIAIALVVAFGTVMAAALHASAQSTSQGSGSHSKFHDLQKCNRSTMGDQQNLPLYRTASKNYDPERSKAERQPASQSSSDLTPNELMLPTSSQSRPETEQHPLFCRRGKDSPKSGNLAVSACGADSHSLWIRDGTMMRI